MKVKANSHGESSARSELESLSGERFEKSIRQTERNVTSRRVPFNIAIECD
jgi:hypothetical protein